jgi:hypothetical protein
MPAAHVVPDQLVARIQPQPRTVRVRAGAAQVTDQHVLRTGLVHLLAADRRDPGVEVGGQHAGRYQRELGREPVPGQVVDALAPDEVQRVGVTVVDTGLQVGGELRDGAYPSLLRERREQVSHQDQYVAGRTLHWYPHVSSGGPAAGPELLAISGS